MKFQSRKAIRIVAPVLTLSAIATTIICVSGAVFNNDVPTISIGGSTAVLPLMNAFSEYLTEVDIVTSAGGSGVGINSIIQGTKIIGMASKNPGILELGVDDPKYETWKEKNVKTLTIAWDGIGLIYKPSEQSKNEDIIIDAENNAKIYHAFSGHKQFTFSDILGNNDQTPIVPYSRNGGSAVSGTTDGFWKDSHLKYKESSYWKSLTKDEQDIIKTSIEKGSYGKFVVETAEANSQAWNRAKTGPIGTMIYLSSGFIINNKAEIEKQGFKIAYYNNLDGELTKENITKNYNWYRPFNLMFSIDQIQNSEPIKSMLRKILFDEEAKNIISREGYIPLTEAQIATMTWNNDISDPNFFANTENSDTKIGYSGAK